MAGTQMNEYVVVYDRDESGAWIAQVPAVPGCHTYGRTLEQARRRIREALSLWIDDADVAELHDEVHLPAEAERILAAYREARAREDAEQERARESTLVAVRSLTEELGLSNTDAGTILGLSRQRVQQLTHECSA